MQTEKPNVTMQSSGCHTYTLRSSDSSTQKKKAAAVTQGCWHFKQTAQFLNVSCMIRIPLLSLMSNIKVSMELSWMPHPLADSSCYLEVRLASE